MSDVEELGRTPNGANLFRKPNGVGGYVYMSNEIGGGVVVWDTALVSEGTLLFAMTCEKGRKCKEQFERRRLLPSVDEIDSVNTALDDSLAMLDHSINDIRSDRTRSAKLAIKEIANTLGLRLPE